MLALLTLICDTSSPCGAAPIYCSHWSVCTSLCARATCTRTSISKAQKSLQVNWATISLYCWSWKFIDWFTGRIFSYPVHRTWEFTSENPIRSVFPLWPVYGLPMLVLRWLWEGFGYGLVDPSVVFWTLRFVMFVLSLVLEDWAVHELFDSPHERRVAVLLVASSYVTWTWQTHTFSNSIETLLVLWSLVLIKRILLMKYNCTPDTGFQRTCWRIF